MAKILSIESINAELSRVKLVLRGKRLYLRATLPVKQGTGLKQQDISTQLNNDSKGLKIAKLRAERLENDLNLHKFQWSDWIDILPNGQMTAGEAVEKYQNFFWETRKRIPSRESDYINTYERFFKELPKEEALTGELLRKYLVRYEVDTYYRMRCYMVFSALAKWADISLPKDWRFLKGKYEVKRDRRIPSDLEIEEIRESINHEGWRWFFGMMAAYGLRPHELFHLDLSGFPVVKVGASTKTGERIIYPLSPTGVNWAKEWELDRSRMPNIKTEGKTNQHLGAKVSQYFYQRDLGIQPYSLRDAYAIRGAKKGIDSLIMSKWMGHSVEVHGDHYLAYIDAVAMEKIWQKSEGTGLRVIENKSPLVGERTKINE